MAKSKDEQLIDRYELMRFTSLDIEEDPDPTNIYNVTVKNLANDILKLVEEKIDPKDLILLIKKDITDMEEKLKEDSDAEDSDIDEPYKPRVIFLKQLLKDIEDKRENILKKERVKLQQSLTVASSKSGKINSDIADVISKMKIGGKKKKKTLKRKSRKYKRKSRKI